MITDCDIYYTFGAVSPDLTAVACNFVEDLNRGQSKYPIYSTVQWSHYIDLPDGTVIFDSITRTETLNSLNYNDGNEVRIPSGGSARYVVVWVTRRRNDDGIVTRAYLMRHSIS